MHGTMTICSIHSQVFNMIAHMWMVVTEEEMVELKEMAAELGGDAEVHDGCCPVCNEAVSSSFHKVYANRVNRARNAELYDGKEPKVDKVDI